jgi:hypothetical protein
LVIPLIELMLNKQVVCKYSTEYTDVCTQNGCDKEYMRMYTHTHTHTHTHTQVNQPLLFIETGTTETHTVGSTGVLNLISWFLFMGKRLASHKNQLTRS